jgi:peptidoglycan hydrolase-like protein with peptidoglycan-binding domain
MTDLVRVWVAGLIALAMAGAMAAEPARAQDASEGQIWVQIEAQPSLAEAEARARAYAGVFPNVAGFALSSGWYGIMIGPFTPAEAQRQLDVLRGERLIPADSYIPDTGRFRQRFWPVGAGAVTPAPTPVAPDAAISEAPLDGAAPEALAAPLAEPAPVPAPAIEESPREARASEAALTEDERKRLQTALQWDGFYEGAIDGSFGAGTRKSMGAWQAARGYPETGILTTAQRAELLAAYDLDVAAIGFRTIVEPEAGIEIVLPGALVEFARYQPPFVQYDAKAGSRWRVLLISQQGDESTLFGLYDLMQTLEIVPMDGARERRRSSFTLTGQNGAIQSYTQAELQGGLIKGFTLVWPSDDAARGERVLAAMKSSFKPVGDRALDDSLGEPLAEDRAGLLAGLEVRRPRLSRSGFYIDASGLVATTTEAVAACGGLTIDGETEADLIVADAASGVALLQPRTPQAPRATAAFQTARPRINAEVAVGGYPYEDALSAPVTTFGTLTDLAGLEGETALRRLSLNSRPGDAGGPVLDASGSVLGMLLPDSGDGTRVLPSDVRFALDGGRIAALLAERGLAPAAAARTGAMPAEDIAALARAMTVLVSCWD